MSRTGTSAIVWAPLTAYMEEQRKKKQKEKEDKHETKQVSNN